MSRLVTILVCISVSASPINAAESKGEGPFISSVMELIDLSEVLKETGKEKVDLESVLRLASPRYPNCTLRIQTSDYRPPRLLRPRSREMTEVQGSVWEFTVSQVDGAIRLEPKKEGAESGSEELTEIDISMGFAYVYQPSAEGRWPEDFETGPLTSGTSKVIYYIDEDAVQQAAPGSSLKLQDLLQIVPPPRTPIRVGGRNKSMGPFHRGQGAWGTTVTKKDEKWSFPYSGFLRHSAVIPRDDITYYFTPNEEAANQK